MSIQNRLQRHNTRQQSGVALITMLMIFAIVTVMTADTTERMGLDIRKTRFYLHNSQSTEYALSAEAIARQILFDDFENDAKSEQNDHLTEDWNNVVIPVEFDHGSVKIVIRDLHARYNINNLLAEDGKVNPDELAAFKRLIQSLQLTNSNNVADNIADWLDSDTTPNGYYSEDTSYLNKSPGYRTANQAISDTSELIAIAQIDFQTYTELSPFIIALPTKTTVNINTSGSEVLSAVSSNLNADKVLEKRELLPSAFISIQEFLEDDISAGAEIDGDRLSVVSEYFEIWIEASFQEHNTYLRSIIHRDTNDGRLALIGRTFSRPLDSSPDNPFMPTGDADEQLASNQNQQSL